MLTMQRATITGPADTGPRSAVPGPLARLRSLLVALADTFVLARDLEQLARRPDGVQRCRERLGLADAPAASR